MERYREKSKRQKEREKEAKIDKTKVTQTKKIINGRFLELSQIIRPRGRKRQKDRKRRKKADKENETLVRKKSLKFSCQVFAGLTNLSNVKLITLLSHFYCLF